MNIDEMNAELVAFLWDCAALARKKNHDYHPDKVGYLEILQTAFETRISVEQDLWGRVRKQFSALRNYVILGHLASEPPRQRMIDIANYMALLAVWDAHRVEIVRDAYKFVRENRPCVFQLSGSLDPQPTCDHESRRDLPTCDNCEFRVWLYVLWMDLDSRGVSLPLTPRPPA